MSTLKRLSEEEIKALTAEERTKYEAEIKAEDKKPIGISQSELDQFKAKNPDLQCIVVEGYDTTLLAGYFRRPNIPELKAVKKISADDEIDGLMTLFNSCKIWVDPAVEANDFLKLSMAGKMSSLMKMQNSFIKNY